MFELSIVLGRDRSGRLRIPLHRGDEAHEARDEVAQEAREHHELDEVLERVWQRDRLCRA